MTTSIRRATDAEVSQVLGWTHEIWGSSREPEAYESFTRGLLASEWGQTHYQFWLGLDAAGAPVCACKRYSFDVRLAGERARALGFGAVFTHPQARRQGHAASMIAQMMAEARAEGHAIALLYSDIAPAYYEALGFCRLGGQTGSAPAMTAPSPFRPWRASDNAALGALWPVMAAHPAFEPFHYERDPIYWRYLLARVGTTLWAYAPEGDEPIGYVAARVRPGRLAISEAGWAGHVDETRFWLHVRALAGTAVGEQAEVTGWLPPGAANAGFALEPITDGVPMVAPLALSAPTAQALWGHDHF